MIHRWVLKNGIRVVAERIPSVKSVSIGLWVNVGSRDEGGEEEGVSHFLEHMFFKGTQRRSAKKIALEIDELGGELNAFTTRESTTFYAKVLDEHFPVVVDLLSDILQASRFDQAEIEKESHVIVEEIKMVEDDPEDFIYDLHIEKTWQGNALAHSILGTPESVLSMTREKILNYIRRTYDPAEMVISVAGRFDLPSTLELLESAFGNYVNSKVSRYPRTPPKMSAHILVKQRKLEQTHLCLGTAGLPLIDPNRYVLYLLSTILGGGASSRLFQEVREERGWAYSIYASSSSYLDGGLFTIYAGTSPENVNNVIEVVSRMLTQVKREGVQEEELERAKRQAKGSMMLGMESTSTRMCRIAKEELYFGRNFTLREIVREIDRVRAKDVQNLAEQLFKQEFLSLTTIGQVSQKTFPQAILV